MNNSSPDYVYGSLVIELLLDIRRMAIVSCSGDGYAQQALKQEIHEWWEKLEQQK
jgi:hypothetical protein